MRLPSPLCDARLFETLTICRDSVCCAMLWETGGCGSFYAISVEHESFKGLTMIKQHRLVNDLLKDDIKDMHGLQVSPPQL